MTMRFGDLIISVIISAPKYSQTGNLSVYKAAVATKNWLFFFSKLILVKFGLSNYTAFATVIRQRFRMAGQQCA